MMKYYKTCFLYLVTINLFSQNIELGTETVDKSKIKSWDTVDPYQYTGIYGFGISEGESNFILISDGSRFYAQKRYGDWADDGKAWINKFENFNEVKIEEFKFFSENTNGEFVIYSGNGKEAKGLVIYGPWSTVSAPFTYELGLRRADIEYAFNGKYNFTSFRLLKESELLTYSKKELQIMRNEIFARYGYKFKPGGMMEAHFKKQNWYKSQHKNVSEYLTDLEKNNIALIRKIEASK